MDFNLADKGVSIHAFTPLGQELQIHAHMLSLQCAGHSGMGNFSWKLDGLEKDHQL